MGIMEGGEEVIRNDESILVSVRLSPLNEKETLKNDVSDWECIDDTTIIYKNANLSVSERSMYPTAYTFGYLGQIAPQGRSMKKESWK